MIPFVGRRWIIAALESRVRDNDEKKEIVSTFRNYFKRGEVFGYAMALLSVVWFVHLQVTLFVPQQQRDFKEKIISEASSRIIEGVIRGISEQDMFIPDFGSNEYRLYIYKESTQSPMVARFVVIFKEAPAERIVFPYINKASYDALRADGEISRGYFPVEIPLCLEKLRAGKGIVKLLHAESAPPQFDLKCEGGDK